MAAAICFAAAGCSEPPLPAEVDLAFRQERELWALEAEIYVPDKYAAYRTAMADGRGLLNGERSRLVWWRDYEKVRLSFGAVLRQGEELRSSIESERGRQRQQAEGRLDQQQGMLQLLCDLASELKDGRLSGPGLARADINLSEARALVDKGRFREAGPLMDQAAANLAARIRLVSPLLSRYADGTQLQRWQRLAGETLKESREKKNLAIVVSKLERELVVYRAGKEIRRYPVGFGFNYLSDKLHAGDRATPEGRYRVQRKNPHSRYSRALLLDYPNAEDRVRFAEAKRRGAVPAKAGIGGLIEIHGGGRKALTNGCVALEDRDMAELYEQVSDGTSVTIVGTLQSNNLLAQALRELK